MRDIILHFLNDAVVEACYQNERSTERYQMNTFFDRIMAFWMVFSLQSSVFKHMYLPFVLTKPTQSERERNESINLGLTHGEE